MVLPYQKRSLLMGFIESNSTKLESNYILLESNSTEIESNYILI